ncbi:LysR family transcriptional regulator [Sulfitobacter mediterraneus]|uniref:LysR family transcriptional regulator n=2 Tax=Sulfitobacter mediterraneus TaxID=83219 RepID=A0A061SSV6_9RHOB|nr:LysR family transcriptional regulator [Sulfitobacter mediterraneus]
MMSTIFPSLDHIPAFHAVMTSGSLSAAARDLRLAQPTVRRHIEALEQELNTQLFTRAANGLTPTTMAETLLPLARAVLEEAAAMHRAASAQKDALAGVVRITSSRVAAAHVLPPLLSQLAKDAPGLRFELAATDHAEDLTRRAADIALRFTPPKQQSLIAAPLGAVEVGLFAHPDLDLPKPQDSLQGIPFISDDREGIILPAIQNAGMPLPDHVVLRCDDPLSQIAHLQSGLGVGFCQVKLATRLGLRRILPDWTYEMPAWLVLHEDQSRIARIRFVFDYLKTQLRHWM